MGKPKEVSINPDRKGVENGAAPSAADRLLAKAQALRGPRGKYRCRKCKELPCVCPDPKQSTPGPSQASEEIGEPAPAKVPVALFTEANSKRFLEVAFGIPTVMSNCKIWALTEEEALELSKPTADVLNEFVTVDPKWVSLTILAASLGSIVSRKAVCYAAWKRAYEIEKARANQHREKPEQPPQGEPDPPSVVPNSAETNGKEPGPSASLDMLG